MELLIYEQQCPGRRQEKQVRVDSPERNKPGAGRDFIYLQRFFPDLVSHLLPHAVTF